MAYRSGMAQVRFRRGLGQPFVGREPALALLIDAFERASAGAGSAVFVTGEPGIGKTRLVEEFTALVAEKGACVNWATCRESAGAPAFWPWVQVIRSCHEQTCADPGELGPRVDDALTLIREPAEAEAFAGEQARFRLFDSMVNLLAHSCAEAPLVIVLDDLHWADLPSLHFLRFLGPELRGHPILVVGTYRDVEVEPDRELGAVLLDVVRGATAIAVPGLHHDEVATLLEAVTGAGAAPDLVATIHERSGGNPLFVGEMARLMITRGEAHGSVPDGIRAVIEHRVARLTQPCHQLLSTAAVLGGEFDVEILTTVADLDTTAALGLLDQAVRARVITDLDMRNLRYRFSHALIRDTLYEMLPLARRVELHDRAATALEDRPGDDHAAEFAFHALRALAGGDPARAVRASQRAGERAMEMLAYEQAVHHFHEAVEAGPSHEERAPLLLLLGEALIASGDVPAARQVFEEAARAARAAGRPEHLARAALGFGAGLSGFEVRILDDAQVGLLREALDVLPAEDSPLRALVLARLSVALSFIESTEDRTEMSSAAVEMARRVSDPMVLAQALAAQCDATAGPDFVSARLEAAAEIADLSVRAGDPAAELLGRRLRLVALLELGDVDAADREIDHFERTASMLRQPLYSWFVPLWRGYQAMAEGRLDDALQWCEEAEAVGVLAHSANAEMLVASQRFAIFHFRGDHERALQVMSATVLALAGVEVSAKLVPAAFAAWARDTRAWERLDFRAELDGLARDSEWLEIHCMVGRAAVHIGDLPVAEMVYERLVPYADVFAVDGIGAAPMGQVSWTLATIAAALGRHDDARRFREQADDAHRRRGMALFLDEALPESRPPSAENAFRREGAQWALTYAGRSVHVRDLKGLHDLATLIAAPDREVAAVDLAGARGGSDPSEGLHAPGDAGELLDARARREYQQRLRELQEEIDEAASGNDLERESRAQAEFDAIVEQLTGAVGFGGRARRAGDPTEKARTAVTWRIKNAIERIAEVHPVLGRHLQKSVRTGSLCSYAPEQPTVWSVSGGS
ncbi:MAG TPA: AAA family ATPase [Acidimicrobiia bacterium]|nr:AAA family ATPase [Acidimicrobiia bacterium]